MATHHAVSRGTSLDRIAEIQDYGHSDIDRAVFRCSWDLFRRIKIKPFDIYW
nr:MAG TPA: hypothetical protein [Caudoviricetes sp.]